MSDELNLKARAFLQSVQGDDDPTRADYDRVHARVKARLAAGIAAGVAALVTSKAAEATAGVATATATAAATATATATAAATGVAAGAPAAALATAGTGAAVAMKIAAVVAVVAAVGGGATAVARHAQRGAAITPVQAASAAPVEPRAAPPARPQIPVNAATSTASSPPAAVAPSVPSHAEPARAPSPAVVPAGPVSAPTAADSNASAGSSLDAEIALLRDARDALRGGDAARSLALLDEHDRRFPAGALTEDCAAERVYALCALGDVERARSAATRFLAEHSFSPHAASVRASCGASGGMN